MKYPISMSVIVVQLEPGTEAAAHVLVHSASGKVTELNTRLNLGHLRDATDIRMWAQMAAASVCDGL